MAEQSFPILVSITNPRSTPDGSAIVCRLQFADGTASDVAIEASRLPVLLNDLRTFGSLAEATQRNLPADTPGEELVVPYLVRSVSTAKALTGEVVLKIGTDQGVPVVLAFSAILATETASSLEAQIARSSEPSRIN